MTSLEPSNAVANTLWYNLSVLNSTEEEQHAYLIQLLEGQELDQQKRILLGLAESGLQQIRAGFGQKDAALRVITTIYITSRKYDYDIREALKWDDQILEYEAIIARHEEQSRQRLATTSKDKQRYLDTIRSCAGWESFPATWYKQIPGRDTLQEWSYIAPRVTSAQVRQRLIEFAKTQRVGTAQLHAYNLELDVDFGQARVARGRVKRKLTPTEENDERDATGLGTPESQRISEQSSRTLLPTPPNTRSPKRAKTTHDLQGQTSLIPETPPPHAHQDSQHQLLGEATRCENALQDALAEYIGVGCLEKFLATLFEYQLRHGSCATSRMERKTTRGGGRGANRAGEEGGGGEGARDGDEEIGEQEPSRPAGERGRRTGTPIVGVTWPHQIQMQKMALVGRFWQALQPLL